MSKFCTNCGNELNENADVCLNCGSLVKKAEPIIMNNPYQQPMQNNKGKGLATISVVFGSLGFYPLIIIGSIVGFITGIVGVTDNTNQYKGRSKIGLWLSVGSFALWILLIILGVFDSDVYW
ncbi:MAG: zinc ribbon domain-containing protein [Bacilli bacterium]|nr:zinc ribbon domain-containing protein [Bacilli bacterium]